MAVSDAQYAKFVEGVELRDIWLNEAHIEKHTIPIRVLPLVAEIETRAQWVGEESTFLVIHGYRIRVLKDEQLIVSEPDLSQEEIATIIAEFGLTYTTNLEVSEEIFERFREVNLLLNSWPYMREFVSSTLARMGLDALIIPAFKVRVPGLVVSDRREEPFEIGTGSDDSDLVVIESSSSPNQSGVQP